MISVSRIESAVAKLVGLALKMSKLVENSKFYEILKMSKIGNFCVFSIFIMIFLLPTSIWCQDELDIFLMPLEGSLLGQIAY